MDSDLIMFRALATSNYESMPTPSSAKQTQSTVLSASSGRNISGRFIGTVVARKRKLALGWKALSASEWARLCAYFDGSFSVYVTFTDQVTNQRVEVEMYAGDRSAEAVKTTTDANGKRVVSWYRNCSISLVEV